MDQQVSGRPVGETDLERTASAGADAAGGRGGLRAWPVLLVVAVALFGIWVSPLVGASIAGHDLGRGWGIAAFVAVAVLGLVARALGRTASATERERAVPLRGVALVAAAICVVVAVVSIVAFVRGVLHGYPGLRSALLAASAVAGTAAFSIVTGSGRWHGGRPPGAARSVGAVVAAAALVAIPLAGTSLAERQRVDHTTAEPAEIAAVPSSVSAPAWRVQFDEPVIGAVNAGTGVAVVVDDGIVAIDGTTGERRWEFHRRGAEAFAAKVSPDGRSLVLLLRPGGGTRGGEIQVDDDHRSVRTLFGRGRVQVVGFDAITGEQRFSQALRPPAGGGGLFGGDGDGVGTASIRTDEVFWVDTDSGPGAVSWETGEIVGHPAVPDGCGWNAAERVNLGTGVLLQCVSREGDDGPAEAWAMVVDPLTGDPIWQLEPQARDDPDDGWMDVATDGSMLRVVSGATTATPLTLLVDPASGEVLESFTTELDVDGLACGHATWALGRNRTFYDRLDCTTDVAERETVDVRAVEETWTQVRDHDIPLDDGLLLVGAGGFPDQSWSAGLIDLEMATWGDADARSIEIDVGIPLPPTGCSYDLCGEGFAAPGAVIIIGDARTIGGPFVLVGVQ